MPAVSTRLGAGNELARRISVTMPVGLATGLSDIADLTDCRLLGIEVPTGLTATTLTFRAGSTASTMRNCRDSYNTEIAIPVTANSFVAVDPALFAGFPFLQVRGGTAAAATTQLTNDVEIVLIVHGLG